MIKILKKSAENAWEMELLSLISENELPQPDFTDCAVEMWFVHDAGTIKLFFRNDENIFWKKECKDLYVLHDDTDGLMDVIDMFKEIGSYDSFDLLFRFIRSDRKNFENISFCDFPSFMDMEFWYDFSNYSHSTYFIECGYKDQYEEVDEVELANTQYKEVVELIKGKVIEEIESLNNDYLLLDNIDSSCNEYELHYKNCRFYLDVKNDGSVVIESDLCTVYGSYQNAKSKSASEPIYDVSINVGYKSEVITHANAIKTEEQKSECEVETEETKYRTESFDRVIDCFKKDVIRQIEELYDEGLRWTGETEQDCNGFFFFWISDHKFEMVVNNGHFGITLSKDDYDYHKDVCVEPLERGGYYELRAILNNMR